MALVAGTDRFTKKIMSEELTNNSFDEREEKDYDLENELMLLKMQAEFGGQVFFPEDDHIPPELKFELLQSVYDFEEAYRNCVHDLVPVYEKIGSPYFLSGEYLTDEGVAHEFQRIKKIMLENQVIFEHEFDYDKRVLYSFIINELFHISIENIEIKGFYKHFIYEEFYPNLEEDLKRQVTGFLSNLADRRMDEAFNEFNHEIYTSSGWISCEEACEKIGAFFDEFINIKVDHLGPITISFENTRAILSFDVCFTATLDGIEQLRIEGPSKVGCSNVIHNLWLIDSISLPGLQL